MRPFLIVILTACNFFSNADLCRAEVRLLVEDAISRGVPLYNSGQYIACAEIYRLCLRSLQLLTTEDLPRTTIERALTVAAEEPPEKAAWTLRYALDEVYQISIGGSSMKQSILRLEMSEGSRWYSLNDNVMGGISEGYMELTPDGIGVFSGRLSLANNGGFSSVRTGVSKGGLREADGLEIKVRGDGRKYSVMLGTDEMRGSWQASFIAQQEWALIRLPFEKFRLSVRGWNPPMAPNVPRSIVTSVGIIIGDKDETPFMLQIDSISGYTSETSL